MSEPTAERTCPVVDYAYTPPPTPVGWLHQRLDGYQDMARPAVRTEEAEGYWIFTDHDVMLDGLQRPDLWSSAVVAPNQPNPDYRWIPIMLDPPEHTKWRQLLGAWFTPARSRSMKAEQQRQVRALVEELSTRGECDYVSEFAQIFPSMVFLKLMGMPQDRLADFMKWEDMLLHQNTESDPNGAIQGAGMEAVNGFFTDLIAERRANPDPEADDIVSAAINWKIDGEPVGDADILNCLLQLFMAGLDTVAGQSAYFMHHLATHASDRKRLVAEPELIPHAVEEMLRVYPIVQTARRATRDEDFHGCPVKKGQVGHFPFSLASRDPEQHENAREVDFDRADPRHLAFGAGPHRCIGSHLGRQELVIMLEEWHKLIPEYELTEPATEHGLVLGLHNLRLRWAVS